MGPFLQVWPPSQGAPPFPTIRGALRYWGILAFLQPFVRLLQLFLQPPPKWVVSSSGFMDGNNLPPQNGIDSDRKPA